MKIKNAIKKLSKYGNIQENGCEWWIERPNFIIGFLPNGEENMTCPFTRRFNGTWYEDYRYYENLTQAIDYVLMEEMKQMCPEGL